MPNLFYQQKTLEASVTHSPQQVTQQYRTQPEQVLDADAEQQAHSSSEQHPHLIVMVEVSRMGKTWAGARFW